jgi:hypothetical protein
VCIQNEPRVPWLLISHRTFDFKWPPITPKRRRWRGQDKESDKERDKEKERETKNTSSFDGMYQVTLLGLILI